MQAVVEELMLLKIIIVTEQKVVVTRERGWQCCTQIIK
jgi:hypothetical protein